MKTKQKYTSEKTSLNQVAKLFKVIPWQSGMINFDNGGGKYDKATEYLDKFGALNIVYDPFNRSKEHNECALKALKLCKADTSTISNVLNVIKEKKNRIEVMKLSKKYARKTLIAVYEGDKSGVGCVTTKGYQNNRKLREYMSEAQEVFEKVKIIRGVVMVCE